MSQVWYKSYCNYLANTHAHNTNTCTTVTDHLKCAFPYDYIAQAKDLLFNVPWANSKSAPVNHQATHPYYSQTWKENRTIFFFLNVLITYDILIWRIKYSDLNKCLIIYGILIWFFSSWLSLRSKPLSKRRCLYPSQYYYIYVYLSKLFHGN